MISEQRLDTVFRRIDSIARTASELIGVDPSPARDGDGCAWSEEVETSLGPAVVETRLIGTPDILLEALEVEVSTGAYSLGEPRIGWSVTYLLESWELASIRRRLPRGAKQRFVEAISQAWQHAHRNAGRLEELAQRRQQLQMTP